MASSSSLSSLVRTSTSTITEEDLDRQVAELILKEAKKKAEKYGQQGIRAYISNNLLDSNAPRANKRFLSSIIRSTDDHNKTVLRTQALAVQEIKRVREERERRERRMRAQEAADARRSRRRKSSRHHDDDHRHHRRHRHHSSSHSHRSGGSRHGHWFDDGEETWDRWDGRNASRSERKRKARNWETWNGDSSDDQDDTRMILKGKSREEGADDKARRRRRHHSRTGSEERHSRHRRSRKHGSSPLDEEEDLKHGRRRRRERSRRHRDERTSLRSRSRSPVSNDGDGDVDSSRHKRKRNSSKRRSTSWRSSRSSSAKRGKRDASASGRSRGYSATRGDTNVHGDYFDTEDDKLCKTSPQRDLHDVSSPPGQRRSRSLPSSGRSPERKDTTLKAEEYDSCSSMSLSHSSSATPGPEPSSHVPSKMDKYFDDEYDPRLDVTPLGVPTVPATGLINNAEYEGWDAMLELLRLRQQDKEEKKRLERLGLLPKIKVKSKKGSIVVSSSAADDRWNGQSTSIMDIEYSKRGSVREWDLGKEGVT